MHVTIDLRTQRKTKKSQDRDVHVGEKNCCSKNKEEILICFCFLLLT